MKDKFTGKLAGLNLQTQPTEETFLQDRAVAPARETEGAHCIHPTESGQTCRHKGYLEIRWERLNGGLAVGWTKHYPNTGTDASDQEKHNQALCRVIYDLEQTQQVLGLTEESLLNHYFADFPQYKSMKIGEAGLENESVGHQNNPEPDDSGEQKNSNTFVPQHTSLPKAYYEAPGSQPNNGGTK